MEKKHARGNHHKPQGLLIVEQGLLIVEQGLLIVEQEATKTRQENSGTETDGLVEANGERERIVERNCMVEIRKCGEKYAGGEQDIESWGGMTTMRMKDKKDRLKI